jgi:FlaA1/EpsC-like NDP-sugar epimerase
MNKKNIIIVGAGGFGKEVAHSLQSLEEFNILGFADDTIEKGEKIIYDYYVKLSIDELVNFNEELYLAIAISDPIARQQIYNKLSTNTFFSFPNIIAKDINIDSSVTLGQGNIIMHGTLMTCNILVGNFNFFNG